MAANKPVWGIDLGQCALKAFRIRSAGDKVEVLDHAYIEHKKILSAPDVDSKALINETVSKFLDNHELSGETIVVAVPGQNTLARFTKLPPVDRKKIPEIVKYEAQQQIPFDMDEVIWDYQVFAEEGSLETEVGIFAMRRELMYEQLRFLSERNLEPAAVQANPLALYNALKYDGLCGDKPIVIVDIGARNTDLIVSEGKSLWTRNIPIGGNHFTEVLLKTFKLSFRKAENLKREAAKSKYARQIFQAMRPVFADLVAEVQRSIGFYTSSRRGVKLNRILAMGNAFKMPGMSKFLQQNLGMEVVRPSAFTKLVTSEAPNMPQLLDQLLNFSVAYGLALQGLDLGPMTSNLLPTEIARQVVWRKKTPWFYGAAACLALSAAIVWGRNIMDHRVVSAAKAEQARASFTPPEKDENERFVRDPDGRLRIDPRARTILEQGPRTGKATSDAQSLMAVNQYFQQILSDIKTVNQPLIAETEELAKLQAEKTVWPLILNMLLDSLPKPVTRSDQALIEAVSQGPQAYKQLIDSDPETFKRGNRRLIFLENIRSTYATDVLAEFKRQQSSSVTPAGGGLARSGAMPSRISRAETVEPEGPTHPGFVLRISGHTPNSGGATFLINTFITALRQQSRKGLYVDPQMVQVPRLMPIRLERTSRGSGPGIMSEQEIGGMDPVTGESIMDDYTFEILMGVVYGDKTDEGTASPASEIFDGEEAE
ncbi:MAG: type IV pilus assembly protein PilM [Phycisphaerales bacterium]|nr:type IV pilus assembly protein PilM [Phycisphaerales bacterium]